MSGGPGQSSAPSKLTGTSSQPVSYHSPSQSYSFGADAAARRVSGPLVGGQSSSNLASARNNQSKKASHKRQRKPRLVDEDAIAEAAAMRSTSSRKGQTSITHLMNFSLPPRPHSSPFRPHRHVTYHSGSHRVDKARYVNANYRFIVNPKKNYHAQATNADVHLDWDTVLQVLVSTSTSQPTSCPICLCVPVAPRMAKCGHIFCLPCLIRFLHAADEHDAQPVKKARWKKCPICWDPVYMSETRCVRWYSGQEIDTLMEGGDVFLRLVMRRPGSTLALPRDGADRRPHGPEDDLPWYNAAEVTDYARFMKGGEEYMISQYDAELEALEKQEQEDELLFGQDSTWTQKAMAAIREAKEKIKGIGNPPHFHRNDGEGNKHGEDPSPPTAPHTEETAGLHGPGTSSSISGHHTAPSRMSRKPGEDDDISSRVSKLDINQHHHPHTKQPASSDERTSHPTTHESERGHPADVPYYFYQALPHFYLSSLDIRILKSAFGDFSLFPSTILPRVEHISTGHIMDDDLRKRVKYLSHLPYGCELTFLECDWTDLVSPSVLEKFSVDIERRRKRNREKAAREEKERIRAEREEDEKRLVGANRRKRSSLSSPSERPFSASDFQPLGPGASSLANNNDDHVDTSVSTASPPWSSSQSRNNHNRQSFAALATPSNSPPSRRTVWGTAMVESSSPTASSSQDHYAPSHDDGWLQNWEAELLAEQQERIMNGTNPNSGSSSGVGKNTPGATPGKKKKAKKITLMSTNARRAA
ncbi:RING finger domain-containing protein [Nannizzia gypsea CBS 118893]|uniref:RING finger domain-containing protein n=1 Tax=Arthroderma gypseum (strain ATCC MYA-4604 / CBS 118893) TaxID=535722 RepID=E4UZ73_ARTGP|nr:RING finger domain-containing protein [Nannizzia gypsea CBS 118893]EFR03403.1 RING finger domain-containing protein [Nannizzia gypsea CBS 118893]